MSGHFIRTVHILSLILLTGCGGWAQTSSEKAELWPEVTSECKPWAYWWWMASAVDKDNITLQLETFQKAGLGGVHIIPIYGARGYEDRYIDYLSLKWMEMLDYTVREGKRLGMGVDMTLGTGWCFGGPTITDELANAVAEHSVTTAEAGQAVTLKSKQPLCVMAYGPQGQKEELTGRIKADGALDWAAPEGTWQVYEVWQKPSGRKVKRAAGGGEGNMLNPFYRDAMQNYLAWFDGAFLNYQGLMPRATYHDSYEYVCNWSPDLLKEFQKRRGYKLEDYLPEFFGEGDSELTARLKGDYRQTLSDTMVDNFTLWAKWSHDKGCLTRNEAHGAPGNLLDLYALSDMPETEFFRGDRNPLVAKFASSASHVAGRQRTSSETGTWLKEHYHVTLGALKNFIDGLFVSGINHVFYHGNCYSPADAPWPGWVFYASTQMNPRNSIWHDADALNGYLARCQSVLQAGKPDNDLLVYWPVSDYWHNEKGMDLNMTVHSTQWLGEQPIGRLAKQLWQKGYSFDYISDRQLLESRVNGKDIAVTGGIYRAVIVPECTHIPAETMQALYSLAEQGGMVLFEKDVPRDVPGLGALEEKRAAVKSLPEALTWQEEGTVRRSAVGQGAFYVCQQPEPMLQAAGIERETLVDNAGLQFIRRKETNGYWYFIINQDEQYTETPQTPAFEGWITLARPGVSVMIMDPMDGQKGAAAVRSTLNGKKQVYLQLKPGQSLILRTFAEVQPGGRAWEWYKQGESTELSGTWDVEFIDGGPGLPQAFKTDTLQSWTKQGGDAERFAGTARYRLAFDLQKLHTDAWLLDLGKVASSARVKFNGRALGAIFSEPFTVQVPDDLVKKKGNVLEIEVTNLSANRIRDLDIRGVNWKYFRDTNIVNIDYKKFDASQWEVVDSGLLGPVRMISLQAYYPE